MQVVDSHGLQAPNICIICEERPDGDVIDTLRFGNFGGGSPFNGRKYVCGRCVGEFAKLFGYEKGSHVEQVKEDLANSQRQVDVIRTRVQHFADKLSEFVDAPGSVNQEGEFVISPSSAPADSPAPVEEAKAPAVPAEAPKAVAKEDKSGSVGSKSSAKPASSSSESKSSGVANGPANGK